MEPKHLVNLAVSMPVYFYGVIVEASTGVVYENQCAGTACQHRQQEGFLVPGMVPLACMLNIIELVGKTAGASLTADKLDKIDFILDEKIRPRELDAQLRVDRSLDAYEAWVPVHIVKASDPRVHPLKPSVADSRTFGGSEPMASGVLFWENSD